MFCKMVWLSSSSWKCKNIVPICFMLMIYFPLVPVLSYTKDSPWYRRYGEYPEYCSTTEQMAERRIPDFPSSESNIGETRLLHVSAVIRHGARTPLGSPQCWSNYYENPSTGVWDCDLTTYERPKPVKGDENSIQFSKHYDAFGPKQASSSMTNDGLSNVLNGTCQNGQLLMQGYDQQVTNGRHLRDAYVYNQQTKQNHDVRMRLIDTTAHSTQADDNEQPWHPTNVYFRSDDTQRTVLSGQILLRSMLQEEVTKFYQDTATDVVIPIHSADYWRDVFGTRQDFCPPLQEMEAASERSIKLLHFNNTKEARILRRFMRDELNSKTEINIMECLLPTICTDRDLPLPIVERGLHFPNATTDLEEFNKHDHEKSEEHRKYGDHIFHRMMEFATVREIIHFQENKAEYSKLAMGPLWAEIIDNFYPIVNDRDALVKLALYSGHDSTIIALLSSLGPKVWKNNEWPTYAGMVVLEIHELVDGQSNRLVYKSQHVFRLLYNGEPITNRIIGCPQNSQLCDVRILLDVLKPIAKRNRDCSMKQSEENIEEELLDDIEEEAERIGVFWFLLIIVGSMFVGFVLMHKYLFKKRKEDSSKKENHYSIPLEELDDDIAGYDIDGLMISSSTAFTDEPPITEDDDPNDVDLMS